MIQIADLFGAMGVIFPMAFCFPKSWIYQKEDCRMAKGGRKRTVKRRKTVRKDTDDSRNLRRIKSREKQSRRSKSLVRQMRGMKWSEEDGEEIEEELEDIQ
jgi:hypothetical protein